MTKSMVIIITDASRWLRPPLDAEKEDAMKIVEETRRINFYLIAITVDFQKK